MAEIERLCLEVGWKDLELHGCPAEACFSREVREGYVLRIKRTIQEAKSGDELIEKLTRLQP